MNFYDFAKQNNLQAYRIKQFEQAYYKQLVESFDEITVFPKSLRDALNQSCSFSTLTARESLETSDNKVNTNTIKTAFTTFDKNIVEAVLIREKDRNTVCVSSQIGCPLGCVFCATGKLGFKRNLSADEIVEQVLYFARHLKNSGQKVTNIVYMGMGEPLLNFQNVMESIEIINSPGKFELGQRNITISTAGVLPTLSELFSKKHQFHIAISLHAPNQRIREILMPSAKFITYETLLNLAFTYCSEFHKRITYEYVLLEGLNDSLENAEELADRLIGHPLYSHVNLIMYNEISVEKLPKDLNLKRCSNNQANRFADVLRKNRISCTIRYSQGEEINSACGQLAGKSQ